MVKSGHSPRRMPPLTKWRSYRLSRRIPLIRAAVFADLSLARASEIERFPERARAGELERLRAAVDRAASSEIPPQPGG
jgi:hypothetical protein